jgi:phage terminase large subunit
MDAITTRLRTPDVFAPLWERPARYKGAHGGRGSGKSHDRAAAAVIAMTQGLRVVGLREVQRSIADSVKQLVEDKIKLLDLADEFDIQRDVLRHRATDGAMIFRGLKDNTATTIKSLEGFDRAWIEEAQTITRRSLSLLTPTIRKPGSEIWATWNPEFDTDAIDVLLRGPNRPVGAVVVEANWHDNPWFPVDLKADMERDRAADVATYEHVWGGGYRSMAEGAYYAEQLTTAREQGRITSVPVERGPVVHTGWDIGIDDCTAIWAAQVVGRELHLIDYYEDRGKDAAHYAEWMRRNGYDTGMAYLPHDGDTRERGTGKTYSDVLREADVRNVQVVPRTASLMADIQATRAFFAKCWFDADRCRAGLKCLGAYRVEWDFDGETPKQRPVHDWSSHGADAFRTLAASGVDSMGGTIKPRSEWRRNGRASARAA